MNIREKILDDTKAIVCKDRNQQYGEPEDNFRSIANFWNDYLEQRRIIIRSLKTADVAMMMDLLKTARIAGAENPTYDSFVDKCGYTACAAEIIFKEDIE